MKSLKNLFIALSLALSLFASTSFGQEDGHALMQECLQAQEQEFKLLSQQRDVVYKAFSNRSYTVRRILDWIEKDHKTADAKRLAEIAKMESQLKVLKEQAELTSADALKDLPATIERVNLMIEDIGDERDIAIKPFARKLSALQRKYKSQETKLESVIIGLFREQLDFETTATIKKAYGSFAFSSGNSSVTYKREGDSKSVVICYLYLVHDKVAKEEHGLFNDKYPIVYRSDNQLEILVGQARVTIYSSDEELVKSGLDGIFTGLVDFEQLESLLATKTEAAAP